MSDPLDDVKKNLERLTKGMGRRHEPKVTKDTVTKMEKEVESVESAMLDALVLPASPVDYAPDPVIGDFPLWPKPEGTPSRGDPSDYSDTATPRTDGSKPAKIGLTFLGPKVTDMMIWVRRKARRIRIMMRKRRKHKKAPGAKSGKITAKVFLVMMLLTVFIGTALGVVIYLLLPTKAEGGQNLWADIWYWIKIGILGLSTLLLLMFLLVKGWRKTLIAILLTETLITLGVVGKNQGWFAGVPWEYWPWMVGALLVGSLLILILKALGPDGVKNWSRALGVLVIVLLGVAIGVVYLFNAMEGYTESKRPKDQLTQNAPSDPKPSRSISVTAPVGKFGPRVANTGKLMWVEPENDVEVRYTGYANIPGGRTEESWTYKKGPNFNPTPKEVYPDKYREKGVIVYWVEVKSLVSIPAKVEVKFD